MTRRKSSHRKRGHAEVSPPDSETIAVGPSAFWTPWLVVIIAIGALARFYYLHQPMRYDESVTYVHFASRSWTTVVSAYTYPNNHVFHSLLVKASSTVFGDAPWAIRLPAFLAGIAMIPLTYAAGLRLFGRAAAHVAAALVAASGGLILYSTNARGYTMICLATLVLMELTLRLRDRPSTKLWIATVLVTALGAWTVPVMLFPAGGLALWFVLCAVNGDTSEPRADLRRLGIAIASTAVLVALFYAPIVARDGLAAITANVFVRAGPWPAFFIQMPSSIAQAISSWTLGWPIAITIVLAIFAIAGLIYERRDTTIRVSVAGSMYVWCAIVLVATHRAPFARVWLFLVAPVSLLAAHGLVHLLQHARVRREQIATVSGGAGVVVALAMVTLVVLSERVATSRDTGTLRDAEPIAQSFATRLRAGDRVIAPLPSNGPLTYYFLRSGVDTTFLSAAPAPGSTVYLIVNTDEGFTLSTRLRDPLMQRFQRGELLARYPSAEIYRLY